MNDKTDCYSGINFKLLEMIKNSPKRVLDLGCGTGGAAGWMKSQWGAHVTGITFSEEEANSARSLIEDVRVADLNTWFPERDEKFDAIYCSHVLEHLYRPDLLLQRLRDHLEVNGQLYVALPNVLYWKVRKRFLFGEFRYEDGGIMDKTHYRFFDYCEARRLLEISGFEVLYSTGDGVLPQGPLRQLLPSSASRWLDHSATSSLPGLFAWQFLFTAKPRHARQ